MGGQPQWAALLLAAPVTSPLSHLQQGLVFRTRSQVMGKQERAVLLRENNA